MAHAWKFVRAGGFDQVEITTGADLAALPTLDLKLWAALACPVKGVEFDERTLELVDLDKDGRIRAPELIAAVNWAVGLMKDPDDLVKGASLLELSAITDETDEGKLLRETAELLLAALDKADAKSITLPDVEKSLEAFSKKPFNGDGVVTKASTTDPKLQQAIEDILGVEGAKEKDKSGEYGITLKSIEVFFDDVRAYADWLVKGAPLRPLGDETPDAFAAFAAVRAKVDDYFARVRVATYDPRALTAVNGEEKQYLELAAKDLNVTAPELERLPVAQVVGDRPLMLVTGVNPAWATRVLALQAKVVKPIIGDKDRVSEAEWKAIGAKLEGVSKWASEKPVTALDQLGDARVRELAASDLQKQLTALVASDKAQEPHAKAIESVEKLVRLNRDLMTLVNNFVSFRDFYSRKGPAIFQAGTLYLDTRACELTVRVADAAKHATMAPLSSAYLVYCDLKNAKSETMQIAAAVMAGDVDNLMVGRNGIFYDRKGQDWDATVTKIVDNPISVRQAFWTPYKKAIRAVEEQLAARAARRAAQSDAQLTGAIAPVAAPVAGAPPPAPVAPPMRFDVGTVAALGVAVGGITAALAAILGAVLGLGMWMPIGLLAILLCISGPSMAIAWLKLRRRNLGPLLDANGWAVNARAIVNIPLGRELTKLAELPEGSTRDLSDPYAEKTRPWGFYVTLLVILALGIAWVLGALDSHLPRDMRRRTVLDAHAEPVPAPAAQ